jgi:uncharacterized protein YgfB (UPF0149 family)
MPAAFDHARLQATLNELHRGADAAEVHATLCGALCVMAADQIDLLRLVDAGVPARSRAPEPLRQLRDEALQALQDDAFGFTPLLPDDEQPLARRVAALAAWCAGFLYGLSLKDGFDPAALSADAREIVHDFSELSRADVEDDAGELEETAYAELVEYVRVGAQLVYMELRPAPTPDPQGSARLH